MNERIKAGSDIHAGDGGYGIGTKENYDAFVKIRNKSLAAARIRRLAEQAGMTDDKYGMFFAKDKHDEDGVDLEKFAELIVRECFYCVEIMEKIAHASNADIPPDYDRQTYLKTLEAVTGLMKAHFGVEE